MADARISTNENNSNITPFTINDNKLHEVFPHFVTSDNIGLFFTFDVTKHDKILAIDTDGNIKQISTSNFTNSIANPVSIEVSLEAENETVKLDDIEYAANTLLATGRYSNEDCIYRVFNNGATAYQLSDSSGEITVESYRHVFNLNNKFGVILNTTYDRKATYSIALIEPDLSSNTTYLLDDTISEIRKVRNNEYYWTVRSGKTDDEVIFKTTNDSFSRPDEEVFDAVKVSVAGHKMKFKVLYALKNKVYAETELWNSDERTNYYYITEIDTEKGTNRSFKFKFNNGSYTSHTEAAAVDKNYIYFTLGFSKKLVVIKVNRKTFEIESYKVFKSSADGKNRDVSVYYTYISGDNLVIVSAVNYYTKTYSSGISILKIRRNDLSIVENTNIISKVSYSTCNSIKLNNSFIAPIVCNNEAIKILLLDFSTIENPESISIPDTEQHITLYTSSIFDYDTSTDIIINVTDEISTEKTIFQFSILSTKQLEVNQLTTQINLTSNSIAIGYLYMAEANKLEIQPSKVTSYFVNYNELLSILATIKVLLVNKKTNKILQYTNGALVETNISADNITPDILNNYGVSFPIVLTDQLNINTDDIKVLVYTDQNPDNLKIKYSSYKKPIIAILKNPIDLSKINNIETITVNDTETINTRYLISPDGNNWYTITNNTLQEANLDDIDKYTDVNSFNYDLIKDIFSDKKVYFALLLQDTNDGIAPIKISYIDDSSKILVTYQHTIELDNEEINITFNNDGDYVVVYF